MKSLCISWSLLILFSAVIYAPATTRGEELHTAIDRLVEESADGTFAAPATDHEFLRRLFLDLTGEIPASSDVAAFVENSAADKRTVMIDRLLQDDRYPRRMAELFNVMLMERRGTDPAWNRFLVDSFKTNRHWDSMVKTIIEPDLTDKSEQGAGYFLTKRLEKYGQNPTDYPGLASDIGRLFMGVDLACAQCHDHLFVDDYRQADFQGLYAFVNNTFIRRDIEFPAIGQKVMKKPLEFQSVFEEEMFTTGPRIPGGAELEVPEYDSENEFAVAPDPMSKAPGVPAFNPLHYLATTLPTANNLRFQSNLVNRLWASMMGTGLVWPLDLHHSDNPATHPELLSLMASEFAQHDFDIKWLIRELALTKVYQRSSILQSPTDSVQIAEAEYRVSRERALSPEQLMWSILKATDAKSRYPIELDDDPELENTLPTTLDQVQEHFIASFANPPREPEVEFAPSVRGSLFLLNSELVQSWVNDAGKKLAERLFKISDTKALKVTDNTEVIRSLYITVLSRPPTSVEQKNMGKFLMSQPNRPGAISQLVWALLSCNEFLINH
ncbi:MAG: DUF1549 domain-containing protein [Planctomycetaceae bacterium]|nr:DUF1549 domain-containing protein [Planctomycetaceae bacterium]